MADTTTVGGLGKTNRSGGGSGRLKVVGGSGNPGEPADDTQDAKKYGFLDKRKKKASPGKRRLSETSSSLEIYAAMIRQARLQTARELLDATQIPDGTLYPILQKRISAGLVVDGERDGRSVYDLTPEGYEHARDALLRLEIDGPSWVRAEARYSSH